MYKRQLQDGYLKDYFYWAESCFGDIDNDGDLDVLMSIFYSEHDTSSIYFHENIGTTTTPAFLDERISPFGLEGVTSASGDPVYQSSPEFVDFDGDGDLDVLVAHEHGFGYFANTGTPVSPAFSAQQHNPFGLFPNYDFKSIDVADLDLSLIHI